MKCTNTPKTLTRDEILRHFTYVEAEGKLYYNALGEDPAYDARMSGKECASMDSKGYIRAHVKGVAYQVHRIIFFLHNNEWPEIVDHKDGVTWNNFHENLRKATYSQNGQNAKLASNNTSGVKGVTWNSSKNKWMARCSVNGTRKHVGYFDSIASAEEALDRFRKEHHGEFARKK